VPSKNREKTKSVRFVALGDVHGSFKQAAKLIDQAKKSIGEIDFVLCVGDVEANRSAKDAVGVATGGGHRRWVGEYPRVLSGAIVISSPVWFIGGEHEPWATLDARGPGEMADNIHFLGRAGVEVMSGIKIGFLSGVHGEASGMGLANRSSRDEKACYVAAEVEALRRGAKRLGGIDVLITHDWPTGVIEGRGDDVVEALVRKLKPTLHLCGPHHIKLTSEIGTTSVEALADVSQGRRGWEGFVFQDGEIRRA
jgi:hypothetical protein